MKPLIRLAVTAVAGFALAPCVLAQYMTFDATATGYFTNPQGTVISDPSFTGTQFNLYAPSGFPATLNQVFSYGSLSIGNPSNYIGDTLTLTLTVAGSSALTGGSLPITQTYTAQVENLYGDQPYLQFTGTGNQPIAFTTQSGTTVDITPTGTSLATSGTYNLTGTCYSVSSVPEPCSMVAAGLGISGLIIRRRKKRSA